ncbi:MAG: hypothetical protein PW789_14825 [Edaphobacter sp.]|uniref:hypothetical protein n=1 Tax=Edaphobacter sp. TaxID=1934404 RepID=UPI0023A4A1C2|nr:hypothetical protein [Edaphobacter sp.]MDE1177851.1 hypothetical protein [Edaphobacter sp.]
MTEAEKSFLKTQVDEVVVLEMTDGSSMLAQILVIVDEGETPDLFCLEVEQTPSGFVRKGPNGHSILLAEIARVMRPPAIEESA